MPKRSFRDTATGQTITFDWNLKRKPTQSELAVLAQDYYDRRIAATEKINEDLAVGETSIPVQAARPFTEMVQDPRVPISTKIGAGAASLGTGILEMLSPVESAKRVVGGTAQIFNRPDLAPEVSGVRDSAPADFKPASPQYPKATGERIAGGMADVLGGAVGLASPGIGPVLSKTGAKFVATQAGKALGAGAVAHTATEAAGLGEGYQKLAGEVAGVLGGLHGAAKPFNKTTPTPTKSLKPDTVLAAEILTPKLNAGGQSPRQLSAPPAPPPPAPSQLTAKTVPPALPGRSPLLLEAPPEPQRAQSGAFAMPGRPQLQLEAPLQSRVTDLRPTELQAPRELQRALPAPNTTPVVDPTLVPRVDQPLPPPTPAPPLQLGAPAVPRGDSPNFVPALPERQLKVSELLSAMNKAPYPDNAVTFKELREVMPGVTDAQLSDVVARAAKSQKLFLTEFTQQPTANDANTLLQIGDKNYIAVLKRNALPGDTLPEPAPKIEFSQDKILDGPTPMESAEGLQIVVGKRENTRLSKLRKGPGRAETPTPENPISPRRKKTQGGFLRFGKTPEEQAEATREALRAQIVENLRGKIMRNEPLTPGERSHFDSWAKEEVMSIDRPKTFVGRVLHDAWGYAATDSYLESNPWTKPVADTIKRASTERDMFRVAMFDGFDTAFKRAGKLSSTDEKQLVALMNGEPIVASAKVHQLHQDLKQGFDTIWKAASDMGVVSSEGRPIGYIKEYFPHILRETDIPEELLGSFRTWGRELFGKGSDPERISVKAKPGDPGYFDRPATGHSSRHAEERTGQIGDNFERDPYKVIRTYIRSMSAHMYEKRAVNELKDLLGRLPDNSMEKSHAVWYLRNWTRADQFDRGFREWRYWDRKIAGTTARSVLWGSTPLQTLHLARLVMQVMPEMGVMHTIAGIGRTIRMGRKAYEQARKAGLIDQIPWRFKTKTEKVDVLGNYFDVGNATVKTIALQANIRKFRDVLKDPDWLNKSINETKRVEGVVAPETSSRAMESIPRTMLQFKYWLLNYAKLAGEATRKREMGKLGRYLAAAILLEETTRRSGVAFWHLGNDKENKDFIDTAAKVTRLPAKAAAALTQTGSVALRTAQKATKELAAGKPMDAAKTVVKSVIPGSRTIHDLRDALMEGDVDGALKAIAPFTKH